MKEQKTLNQRLNHSITVRLIVIGLLSLLLLIPLYFIQNLIEERANRQTDVIEEINNQWGKEVLIYGPILQIPYKTYTLKTITNKKTNKTYTESIETVNLAYFFPEELNLNTTINPEEKKRGIYTTAVYHGDINISGTFKMPDFGNIEIKDKDILWSKAKLILKSSNIKGVNKIDLRINNNPYNLRSKFNGEKKHYNEITLHTLETKKINSRDLKFKSEMKFAIQINIKGSQQLQFIPIGKNTSAQVTSNWKTANFIGSFLPYNKNKVTEDGFNAKWKIIALNRPFSQQHFKALPKLNSFSFGVNFMIPVDEYQKSERSAKYGLLVISLTFVVFFLIQTLSKINIHPFQYLMIGLALTMFYTLLVSISEHSDFFKAYVAASIAVISLITLYSKSILKTLKFCLFIFSSLTILYTFIYIIIQLENYALIVGSIGLFIILAIIMFISRRIDWQNG